MDKQKLHELRVFATEIRLETLKVIASRGFGHVGGSMSMCKTSPYRTAIASAIDIEPPT